MRKRNHFKFLRSRRIELPYIFFTKWEAKLNKRKIKKGPNLTSQSITFWSILNQFRPINSSLYLFQLVLTEVAISPSSSALMGRRDNNKQSFFTRIQLSCSPVSAFPMGNSAKNGLSGSVQSSSYITMKFDCSVAFLKCYKKIFFGRKIKSKIMLSNRLLLLGIFLTFHKWKDWWIFCYLKTGALVVYRCVLGIFRRGVIYKFFSRGL